MRLSVIVIASGQDFLIISCQYIKSNFNFIAANFFEKIKFMDMNTERFPIGKPKNLDLNHLLLHDKNALTGLLHLTNNNNKNIK